MENALKNPITAKRIEFICGSIEAFLADPSKLGHSKIDPNFSWMRTVTPEEGQRSLARMLAWAKSDKPSSGGTLGDWLFKEAPQAAPIVTKVEEPPALVMGLTPGRAQRGWRTPSEFPSCPPGNGAEPLAAYTAKLEAGAIFSRNRFSESVVAKAALTDDRGSVWVKCDLSGRARAQALVARPGHV